MAMDALKNLTGHVPSWLTRLDELSGQVDKRQAELAAIAALEAPDKLAETRSLRNKGSQESLKPADDGPSFIPAAADEITESPLSAFPTSQLNVMAATPSDTTPKVRSTPSSPAPAVAVPSPPQKHARDAAAAVHSRARAQAKKRTRSTSVISADGVQTAYRTRTMIIVYYDSYVQGFFDELVRYISMSRNLLRKAKVAARMAQIKKLAEVDSTKTGEDGEESLPSLRYMSSRRFGPAGMRPGFGGGVPGNNEAPDIYDTLDKGLEAVQSTCEHGAHQFLRDADCNEEIKKIQNKLREVLDTAEKETERILREEPELAQETGELTKPRTHRPVTMRKDYAVPAKDSANTVMAKDEKIVKSESGSRSVRSKTSVIEPSSPAVEIDTSIAVDDGISMEYEMPKMQYRSTRALRYRAEA